MLILTRRIGESVYIGDEVRLTVLGVRGTQVRIGINAPKDIPVHREEIYYKIKQEKSGVVGRTGYDQPRTGMRPGQPQGHGYGQGHGHSHGHAHGHGHDYGGGGEPGNRRSGAPQDGNYAEPEGEDDNYSPEEPDPHNS